MLQSPLSNFCPFADPFSEAQKLTTSSYSAYKHRLQCDYADQKHDPNSEVSVEFVQSSHSETYSIPSCFYRRYNTLQQSIHYKSPHSAGTDQSACVKEWTERETRELTTERQRSVIRFITELR